MPNTDTQTTETASDEFWLDVHQAAAVMGIKRRRMLDYRDKVKSRRVHNPQSGKSFLMFERESVEALRDERALARATPFRPPAPDSDDVVTTVRPNGGAIALPAATLLQAIAAAVQQPPAAPPLGLFLDLDQASVYAGLSRRLLRSMIGTGELPARRDGRAWKIRKSALRAISHQSPEDNRL